MGWVTVGAGLFAVTLVVGLGAVALVRDRSLTATVAQAGVTVVFGLVGLFLSVYGTANVIQGRASASWSAAEGTVVESTIERVRYSKRNEERAVVRYEFNANGRRYTGDRIAFATDDGYFGPTYRTGDRLHDILADYPRGATVTAHYDPEAPTRSVLVAGVQTSEAGKLGFGLASVLSALVSLITLVRSENVRRLLKD